MVKVWDVAQRAYVETLFGHQEGVCALDALTPDTLVTGSADRSLRLWKVADETQLVFSGGHTASVDCCAMLNANALKAAYGKAQAAAAMAAIKKLASLTLDEEAKRAGVTARGGAYRAGHARVVGRSEQCGRGGKNQRDD